MPFCSTIENRNTSVEFFAELSGAHQSIWDKHTKQNPYLSRAVQDALKAGLEHFEPLYTFVYQHNELIGLGLVQYIELKSAREQILPYVKYVPNVILNLFFDETPVKMYCNGNAYLNGENAFVKISDAVSQEEFHSIWVETIINFHNKNAKRWNEVMLVKELEAENTNAIEHFERKHFRRFSIGDVMFMDLKPEWNIFEDYLADLTSKYRTRVNQTFQKSQDLVLKQLDVADIEHYSDRIDVLLSQVIENANFKLVEVNAHCMLCLKKNLGDHFIVHGYFHEELLVGFSGYFKVDKEIDAHIVGFEYEINKRYHIYQRMLLDFVQWGIHEKAERIRLGRTSELMKSCLGAQPKTMYLFLRHQNRILNTIMKPILNKLKMQDYELRSPFKQMVNA